MEEAAGLSDGEEDTYEKVVMSCGSGEAGSPDRKQCTHCIGVSVIGLIHIWQRARREQRFIERQHW